MNETASARTMKGFAASALADILTRGNLILLAAVAVVGLLGLSGGFREADPPGVQRISAASAAASVTVVETRFYTAEIGQARTTNGKFEVPVRLTLNGSKPLDGSWELWRLFSLKDQENKPNFERPAGKYPAGVLTVSPGVPVDMTISWPDTPGPKNLVINEIELRAPSFGGKKEWFDAGLAAEVALR